MTELNRLAIVYTEVLNIYSGKLCYLNNGPPSPYLSETMQSHESKIAEMGSHVKTI